MNFLRYLILPLVLLAFGCKTYKEHPDLVDIRRYTPSAERGDAWAQYHLGQAYASHWRYVEACAWYRKAAVQGNADAMYALGQNYLSGYGVPQNPIETYAWFDIAASQNQLLARNARESLIVRMTRSETEEGNRRAAVLITEIPPQNLIYAHNAYNKDKVNQVQTQADQKIERKTTPPPPPTAAAKPASKTPAPTTGNPLHYGSTVSKGGMVQTAP